MSTWLLDRLFETGDQAEPRFAFQGTVNWMRALAEAIKTGSCADDQLANLYHGVRRRSANREADTAVFEKMHMAYHNLASLQTMRNHIEQKYDICRSAIISWYYSIYFSAGAMIAASSGSVQETHAATAKIWKAEIAEKKLIPYPFDLCLSSLVKKTADAELASYRGTNSFDLNESVLNAEMAHGALVSYLKGTHKYKKWETEEWIKSSKEFKKLGVSDFRKKVARELRDEHLDKGQVSFLTQAFRYRGKANYRDSIFLSYGDNNGPTIRQFVRDLRDVSATFIRIASTFCSIRVEKGTWKQFIDDVARNTRLSLAPEILRI